MPLSLPGRVSRFLRWTSVALVGALLACRPSPASAQTALSQTAATQIDALLREKAGRTPAQRKIDSQLIYASRMIRGQSAAANVPQLETRVVAEADGRIVVDVIARVSDQLLAQFRAIGVEVISASAAYNSARIRVRLADVEQVAALPAVLFVQPKQEATTFHATGPLRERAASVNDARSAARRAGRAATIEKLAKTLRAQQAVTNVGSRSSEGDTTHRAAFTRTTYGIDGTGVKIGVLSDGVTNLAGSQAAGDLGAVTVLPGQTGSGDEGTAMLEIIHDLAPGAQLYFATAFSGIASFAQNIRDLRTAGCDIIVDDVFYYVETPFQDGQTGASQTNAGVVSQAVKDVVANGALYFSSAGNSGNADDGTSGVWEGNFLDGGSMPTVFNPIEGACQPGCRLHSFGGVTYNLLTASSGAPINLYWSDPLGTSTSDYDLFRLDSSGTTVLAASVNIQDGSFLQDPYEQIGGGAANQRIVIVKYAGADRYLHLDTNGNTLSLATGGQTHGHAAVSSPNAFGVAATPAQAPGPYPNPFNSANMVETFSSDGPRRIFFNGDGTPITPGNFLATGGMVLNKPDITAADGVSVTGVGGFPSPFYGTSAAAPHAGAIAGLLKSLAPTATAAQIRVAMVSTAIDIEGAGLDRSSGAGIVMADRAAASMCGTYSIFPTSAAYDATGGGGSITVTAGAGCGWTATSNDGFIHVTGGSSGTGVGTVTYTVDQNVGAANVENGSRSGSITIHGLTFSVTQTGCTFAIGPTAQTFGSGGGAGAVAVATPSACSWTVTSLPAWASTTSGGGGTGSGTWRYSVQANAGAQRSATPVVAGKNFSLLQLSVAVKTMTAGRRSSMTLANAADARLFSFEAIAGRSYCAQFAPGALATAAGTPTLSVLRANNTTSLGGGSSGDREVCFVAPASESVIVNVHQAENSALPWRLAVTETSIWSNWFFIAGDYASWTLLRNVSSAAVNVTITWRSGTGTAMGTQMVSIPAGGIVAQNAAGGNAGSATSGSVDVGHSGPPGAIVGSQTTLSATGGLSFDTLFVARGPQ
ncbi:MAG TPA: S8 family serine peptidase [Vicinamibacterales bacterium]|jgi:hypothetical protein